MTAALEGASRDASQLYGALRLETDDSIRILDIQPGTFEDDVRVSLRVATLSSNPEYEALSYTWGASTEGRTITVNSDYQLLVTDNLYNALRGLRQLSQKRSMWIDALCINQDDIEEKNSQVMLMTRIYALCPRVAIWLGQYSSGAKHWTSRTLRFTRTICSWSTWRYPLFLMDTGRDMFRDMDEALARTRPEWHRRVWTLQEAIFAERILLCFGTRQLLFSGRRLPTKKLGAYKHLQPFVRALRARLIPVERYLLDRSIAKMVWLLQGAEATDPRDFVYAILGLIRSQEAAIIKIDYNLPCHVLYSIATFASLKCSGTYETLRLALIENRRTDRLPTWSLDFANIQFPDWVRWDSRFEFSQRHPYHCPQKFKFVITSASLDDSQRYLSIAGVTCDTIARVVVAKLDRPKLGYFFSFVEKAAALAKATLKASDHKRPQTPCAPYLLHTLHELLIEHWSVRDKCSTVDKTYDSISARMHEYYADPADFLRLWNKLMYVEYIGDHALEALHVDNPEIESYLHYARLVAGDGMSVALFVTHTGLMGLAPPSVSEGDALVLIPSKSPFMVLRRRGDRYAFRGLPWVHGFMNDAFWFPFTGEGLQEEIFVLE